MIKPLPTHRHPVSPVMCALMYNTQHNAVKISLTNPGALTIWDLRKYLIRSHQSLAHRSICLEIPQMTHKLDSSSAVVHWPGPNEDLWNPVTPLFQKWLGQNCVKNAAQAPLSSPFYPLHGHCQPMERRLCRGKVERDHRPVLPNPAALPRRRLWGQLQQAQVDRGRCLLCREGQHCGKAPLSPWWKIHHLWQVFHHGTLVYMYRELGILSSSSQIWIWYQPRSPWYKHIYDIFNLFLQFVGVNLMWAMIHLLMWDGKAASNADILQSVLSPGETLIIITLMIRTMVRMMMTATLWTQMSLLPVFPLSKLCLKSWYAL